MRLTDHLTCLLRNPCEGREATIRTGHETMDWFQIGKGVSQGCILSPCSFNLRIPDHLSCLLRNLYAGQEATVRTGHGTMGWFQIGKGVHQACILPPCLFNLNVEYITSCTLVKCRPGWITSWNQDCQEKYKKLQIRRWHHSWHKAKRN